MKDYYKTLELKSTASAVEIKQAYRRLSKKYHPDINKNGSEQFKAINEANSILSNPISKKAYDKDYITYYRPKSTSNQQTSNTVKHTPNRSNTQHANSSSTITVNGVKINVSSNNKTTIKVVNGKVIIETS
jgi:curved DNA-binding protein CbpA